MGAGASLAHTQSDATSSCYVSDSSTLPSTLSVHASQLHDRYRVAYKQSEDILGREQAHCASLGYGCHQAQYQPLMRKKLGGGLHSLDAIAASHGDDQRRSAGGYTKVPVSALTAHGSVGRLCVLPEISTLVCASTSGPLWAYNWKAGEVLSEMRLRDGSAAAGQGQRGGANTKGAVLRLCQIQGGSMVATGDEIGYLQLWDLRGPGLNCETRLHQGRTSGLRYDEACEMLYTTASDSHLMVFDIRKGACVDRAKPASATCGDGVPNTALATAFSGRSKMLLVGGADGKLRIWTQDGGPFQRQHVLPCNGAAPTEIRVCSDGFRAAVATGPADTVLCGGHPERGGLMLLDLRKLGGEDGSSSALVAKHEADGSHSCSPRPSAYGAPPGCLDMTLTEENGETLALCVVDGFIRAFDLGRTSGPRLTEPEVYLERAFDFDVVARYDEGLHPSPYPLAVAAAEQYVFTATTAPSLGVWCRRGSVQQPYWLGGSGKLPPKKPEGPDLLLRSHCVPKKYAAASGGDACGATLHSVHHALEHDRWKMGHVLRPDAALGAAA